MTSQDCKDGHCPFFYSCKSEPFKPEEYGPGEAYTINTLEPYSVEAHFNVENPGSYELRFLHSVNITLRQNGKLIHTYLLGNCNFGSLTSHLDRNMAMAISTYSLDSSNNPLTDKCTQACSSGSTTISGIEWFNYPPKDLDEDDDSGSDSDSDIDDSDDSDDNNGVGVLQWGKAAPNLTSG